ncbi:class F sortase [Luteococcus japonicus]|uniref:class F sortase n=1 Tax=Luteococcus japonicus TaxID=33984 RepID=UPI0011CDE2EA|nr:class F sortase [Luteococcus japonicus]
MDRRRGRGRSILAIVSGLLAVGLFVAWWLGRDSTRDHQGTEAPVQGTPSAAGHPSSRPSSPGSTSSASTSSASTATTRASTASRTPSAGASSSGSSPSGRPPGPSASSLPEGCSTSASPLVPTRITLGDVASDAPVMSLGLAADGTAAAPPKDQPKTVGWYNLGPRPGSDKGKVVLTAHTYHRGGALGNALNSEQGLRLGDVIRLTDASGRTLCYRHTRTAKVMVKDYDPKSTVLYDDHGAPMLAIVICWDYERSTKFWASRIIFYAEPLAAS